MKLETLDEIYEQARKIGKSEFFDYDGDSISGFRFEITKDYAEIGDREGEWEWVEFHKKGDTEGIIDSKELGDTWFIQVYFEEDACYGIAFN